MKDRKQLIISIAAVLILIVLVVGATLAYWSWQSNTADETNVSFSIANNAEALGLSATLDGNGTVAANDLIPTSCTDPTYAVKKEVVINSTNTTNQAATVEATLTVTAFTIRNSSYQPTPGNLTYLKWAITTSDANCTTNPVDNGSFTGITFSGTSGSNLPFPLKTISFSVPANTAAQENTYYLWIWLDSSYNHTNYGSVISDPMQNLSFTASWSGTINNQ